MKSFSYTLGVDPGLSGAFALYSPTARHLITYRMPTATIKVSGKKRNAIDGVTLAAWLDCHRNLIRCGYVEQVSSRPRQAGQFQFGINTGVIHGMLWANIIPWSLVAPAAWKYSYGIKRLNDEAKADKKSEARAIAASLFPDNAHEFKRVMDDGVAEAALIALYGANMEET